MPRFSISGVNKKNKKIDLPPITALNVNLAVTEAKKKLKRIDTMIKLPDEELVETGEV